MYKLCLQCLECISSQLSCKPYSVHFQRVRMIHCFEACSWYKDAEIEGFRVLEELRLGSKSGNPKGRRLGPVVAKEGGDCELGLLVQAVASIKDGKRILFQFDRAAFSFKFLPFKVPYLAPFRLLGDEAKGWLDTTYLSQSGNLRISRGNKASSEHSVCFAVPEKEVRAVAEALDQDKCIVHMGL